MTEYETASLTLQGCALIAQVLIGAIQCALIAGGLWSMKKTFNTRDGQHQEARDRHQETMEVLHQQREVLRQQGEALRALIERTAPPA